MRMCESGCFTSIVFRYLISCLCVSRPRCGRLRTTALIVVVLASHCTLSAHAFDSNFRMTHESMTEEACRNIGFSQRAARGVGRAVAAPDWRENSLLGSGHAVGPNRRYRAEHHFDRGPGSNHKQAFQAGAAYVRATRQRFLDQAAKGSGDEATATLGQCLHALQDFFSHSNFVDLSPATQRDALIALWDSERALPDSLWITAYYPEASDPEEPNDPLHYTHGQHSKDNRSKNDDAKAHYNQAYAAASRASIMFLGGLRQELKPATWKRVVTGNDN